MIAMNSPETTGLKDQILVIDDEFGPRESLRILFKHDYDVVCTDSVEDGLESLRNNPPDVIILDICMPYKDGLAGLREIRAIDSAVSIVMLTGFGSLDSAREAMQHGANDYIKKPFDTNEMRNVVERYVKRTRLSRREATMMSEVQTINSDLNEQLRQKNHLVSLGEASSELVHDLRSPLTVISGYVQLLTEELQGLQQTDNPSTQEIDSYLKIIDRNVGRCREMSEMWRDLARKSGEMEPLSVNQLLEEIRDNAFPTASHEEIELMLLPAPQDTYVLANHSQLHRALQNLVNNALDAVQDRKGRIEISAEQSGNEALIHVVDNGCGIDTDSIEEVFTPHYTTKQGSGGMGIGLIISRKIVEAHNGRLDLANNPDEGIRAVIGLPICSPA